MRLLVVVAVGALALGGATATPVGKASSAEASFHLVLTSDRDGDADAYATDEQGGRLSALTRNDVEDHVVVAPGSGAFLDLLPRANPAVADAVLVSPDGRRQRKLGLAAPGDAAFSPDGRSLAIGRVNARGRDERMVLVSVGGRGPARELCPGRPRGFSQDGRYLWFANPDQTRVGIVDVGSGRSRLFALHVSQFATPVWSPNLTRFVYLPLAGANQELDVIGARPGAPRQKNLYVGGGADLWASQPVWVDEQHIALARSTQESQQKLEYVVVDVNRGTMRTLFTSWADKSSAAFSPSGGAIAYVVGLNALAVTSVGGDETRTLRLPGRIWGPLAWSPRGDQLAALVGPKQWAAGGSPMELDLFQVTPRWRHLRTVHGFGFAANAPYAVWTPDERAIAARLGNDVYVTATAGGGAAHPATDAGHAPGTVAWSDGALAEGAPKAPALPPAETGGSQLHTRGKILEMTGSGSLAAAIVGATRTDCTHVVAWSPGGAAVRLGVNRQLRCLAVQQLEALQVTGTKVSWNGQCGESNAPCGLTADVRTPQQLVEAGARRGGAKRSRRAVHQGLTISLRNGAVLVRRSHREQTTIQAPGGIVDVAFEDAGLFYAWNTSAGGTVAFVPISELQARVPTASAKPTRRTK